MIRSAFTTLAAFASLLCAASALGAATHADTSWVGYGGPGGKRIYADAAPPTTFTFRGNALCARGPNHLISIRSE